MSGDADRRTTTPAHRAAPHLVWGSAAIDLALSASIVTGAGLLLPATALTAIPLTLLALVLAAAWLTARWTLGRSVGHAALGLRSIDRISGMPGSPFRRGRLTLDIRHGPDPLVLTPHALSIEPTSVVLPDWYTERDLVIVFDDGTRFRVRGACTIGRDPKGGPPGATRIAVPDFSGSLAPTHLHVTLKVDVLTVTDLGSPTGTAVEVNGRSTPLVPNRPERVPAGSVLRLGDRRVTLQPRHEAPATAGVTPRTAQRARTAQ